MHQTGSSGPGPVQIVGGVWWVGFCLKVRHAQACVSAGLWNYAFIIFHFGSANVKGQSFGKATDLFITIINLSLFEFKAFYAADGCV